MIRRSFLTVLFAPLLKRFAPKPQFNSGVAIARAHDGEWVEVTEIYIKSGAGLSLYRSVNGGPFEIMDCPFMQPPFVIVRASDPPPWGRPQLSFNREPKFVTRAVRTEFRERYPSNLTLNS